MESKLKSKLISSYKKEMVAFLKAQPDYFNEAIELAISDDQPFAWRSAVSLNSCMGDNDTRVKKYIKPKDLMVFRFIVSVCRMLQMIY